jgi:NAD(P)-dependent dehydrogenase (short-subunit alcohol dehydrogenase family)
VEPGLTDTAIRDKAQSQYTALTARLTDRERAYYQDYIQARAAMTTAPSNRGGPPERVARVIEHALTTRRPRPRHFASADVRGAYLLGRIAPGPIRDLALTRLLGFPAVDRQRG